MLSRQFKPILFFAVGALLVSSMSAANAQATNLKYQIMDHISEGVEIAPVAIPLHYQAPNPVGGLLMSSWWEPYGSPTDSSTWDNFTLHSLQDITEVSWVGGYDTAYYGSGGSVFDFTVTIYPSIAGESQPNIQNPLVSYQTNGNAWETYVETLGGIVMYKYSFVLPVPFSADAGVTYWLQIQARQHGYPNWGIAKGVSGDKFGFIRIQGDGEIINYIQEDAAFTLLGPATPLVYID